MHAGPPDLDLDLLPPEIRGAVERQMAAFAAERAARLHLESENAELKAHNTRLQHLVREFERARYGRRSEKLDPDQLSLALEDIETAVGAALEAEEARTAAQGRRKPAARPGSRARSLPAALPRIERVIEPDSIRCPCGCGDMVRIGEGEARARHRSERRAEPPSGSTSCRPSSG